MEKRRERVALGWLFKGVGSLYLKVTLAVSDGPLQWEIVHRVVKRFECRALSGLRCHLTYE